MELYLLRFLIQRVARWYTATQLGLIPSRVRSFLCGVCMFYPGLSGIQEKFSGFTHSPHRLGELITLNCLEVWI